MMPWPTWENVIGKNERWKGDSGLNNGQRGEFVHASLCVKVEKSVCIANSTVYWVENKV